MKKKLITVLLLVMSLPILSQNTKRDSVTVSIKALISMQKESRKCDTLRVAYNLQFETLNSLLKSNLVYFEKIEAEQLKRIELQKKLDESIKALRKKKNNWLLPASIGVVGGLVGGLLLVN